MDFRQFYSDETEKPLDRLVSDGGFAGIFRTVGIVGDSLSAGEFESLTQEGFRGCHDFYEYAWGSFLARTIGCQVHNFSRGGMTAREFFETWGAAQGAFGQDRLCQAYIIALGVNDVNRCDSMGDVESALRENPSAAKNNGFLHYYAGIIKRLKARQPYAKFFLMTIPRMTFVPEEQYQKHCLWNQGIRDLAARLENTYVLDFHRYAPIYDEKMHQVFFAGHMRPTGYLLTAKMILSYIDYLIRRYPDDFAEVGFIGTPYAYYANKKEPSV